jgi:tRNA U34 5-methylaminomethyl-2-thiouridine-forming methyltransferase MnmC
LNQGLSKNQFFKTGDGSLSVISGRFGERYHSCFGAVAECYHISVLYGLNAVLPSSHNISILEIGFGTGLNAWITFVESLKYPGKVINYTALEGFPLDDEEVSTLNYEDFFPRYRIFYRKIQGSEWNKETKISENFHILKVQDLFEDFPYPESYFKLVLYDPFAPGCQPEMWGKQMLRKMFHTMVDEGVLVTYCAQGEFRRSLKECGFTVEKLPGPPGKREMTRAIKYR